MPIHFLHYKILVTPLSVCLFWLFTHHPIPLTPSVNPESDLLSSERFSMDPLDLCSWRLQECLPFLLMTCEETPICFAISDIVSGQKWSNMLPDSQHILGLHNMYNIPYCDHIRTRYDRSLYIAIFWNPLLWCGQRLACIILVNLLAFVWSQEFLDSFKTSAHIYICAL